MYWIKSKTKLFYCKNKTEVTNTFKNDPTILIYNDSEWVKPHEVEMFSHFPNTVIFEEQPERNDTSEEATSEVNQSEIFWLILNESIIKCKSREELFNYFILDNHAKILEGDAWIDIKDHHLFNAFPRAEQQVQETDIKFGKKISNWFNRRFKYIGNLQEDFFPPRRSLDETGIHAKLNYHVIVEGQTRKLSYLFLMIITFSISVFTFLYLISIKYDPVMTPKAIEGYISLIYEIKEAGITEEPDLEKNTEFYWTVYYIRYLTVRILIASVFVSVLFFLIRVYMRIRDDRSITLQREEALSAMQYIARGEWAYQYDKNGNYIIDPNTGIPRSLQYITGMNYSTKELMRALPVETLFSTTVENKDKKNKNKLTESIKNSDIDVDRLASLTAQVGILSVQLANLNLSVKNLKEKEDIKAKIEEQHITVDNDGIKPMA